MSEQIISQPEGTLPKTFSEWSDLKGAYRFLNNPRVTPGKLLQPHSERTLERARGRRCLFIEDTTTLNFSRESARGMGAVGNGRNGEGFFVHNCLAVEVTGGLALDPALKVLGLAAQTRWARGQEPYRKPGKSLRGDSHATRLSRQRESQRWGVWMESGMARGQEWVYLADRESDIYEVFGRCKAAGMNYVIRASHPRALIGSKESLLEEARSGRKVGEYGLKLRARPGVPARECVLEIRVGRVTVRGPWRPGGWQENIEVNLVHVRERGLEKGGIEWTLLTDLPVESFEEASRVVGYYRSRWTVEEYHKGLKTGLKIEESLLESRAALERLLAVLSIAAVWLLELKFCSRQEEDELLTPGAVDDLILRVLEKRGKVVRTRRELIRAIAKLGGFIGRKSDGEPGWINIWRGWSEIAVILRNADLFQKCG